MQAFKATVMKRRDGIHIVLPVEATSSVLDHDDVYGVVSDGAIRLTSSQSDDIVSLPSVSAADFLPEGQADRA